MSLAPDFCGKAGGRQRTAADQAPFRLVWPSGGRQSMLAQLQTNEGVEVVCKIRGLIGVRHQVE
jgi:hypothetical protein